MKAPARISSYRIAHVAVPLIQYCTVPDPERTCTKYSHSWTRFNCWQEFDSHEIFHSDPDRLANSHGRDLTCWRWQPSKIPRCWPAHLLLDSPFVIRDAQQVDQQTPPTPHRTEERAARNIGKCTADTHFFHLSSTFDPHIFVVQPLSKKLYPTLLNTATIMLPLLGPPKTWYSETASAIRSRDASPHSFYCFSCTQKNTSESSTNNVSDLFRAHRDIRHHSKCYRAANAGEKGKPHYWGAKYVAQMIMGYRWSETETKTLCPQSKGLTKIQ